MYDYVIVGSGLFGSVCAYELTKKGNKCLVLEKRNHIGGNCYTEKLDGINVHTYGPHIFHTSNKEIWDYVNQFAKFNSFINRPKVIPPNSGVDTLLIYQHRSSRGCPFVLTMMITITTIHIKEFPSADTRKSLKRC